MPTEVKGSPSRKRKPLGDAAVIENLAGYASTHGLMFASGERTVPVTITGLRYAKNRSKELAKKPPTPKSIFRRETADDKERKTLDILFKCFRECPKLRIQPGSKSVDCSSIDLEDFYSLVNIEFVGCSIGDIQHPPLGLEMLSLVQSHVFINQLGEQLETIAIDDSLNAGIDIAGIARLSNTLVRLEISNSLKNPKALRDIFGTLEWKKLRSLEITNNTALDVMDPFFDQLRVVRAMKLSGNSIKTVKSLIKCSELRYLDLSRNNIESLSDVVFPKSLTKLDISKNKLTSLDGLYSISSLSVLALDDNHLRSWNEVFHLLKVNNNIKELTLAGNHALKSDCQSYRPLVAGMIDFTRWRGFLLDGEALSSDDTNKTTVKSVCSKYKQFFLHPGELSTPIIIGEESPAKARSRLVNLCPEYTFEGPCEPCVAACLVVSALVCVDRKSYGSGSATSDLQQLPLVPAAAKTRRVTKKKVITKTRTIRRSRTDRGMSVFQTPEKGSVTSDVLSPGVEGNLSSSESSPQPASQDLVNADDSLISSYSNSPQVTETIAYGSIDVQKGGFLNGIVSHSLSDGTSTAADISDPIVADADCEGLSQSEIETTTSVSWRNLVDEISERLSAFLEAGTITPRVTRVSGKKWGSSKIVPFAGSYPYHIALLPPNMIDPEPSRFVALDATIIGESLVVRIRCSDCPSSRKIPDIINDFSSDTSDGVRTGDGFSTIHVELFREHDVQETSPPASTISLANVKTWEVGEPRPWDPKSVTVDPSKNDMYVTTNRGVTYLQRKQQAEIKASFHPPSESVLMAGFEVPGEECEEILVAMLKARLKKCKKAAEWPIVSNKGTSSTGRQVFSFDHPPFRNELSSCKKVATRELRILNKLQVGAEDVFMYFGSTVSGSRRLDLEALEKYDVRVGVHILNNNEKAFDVNEGEQLVGSCYTNVLLGAASEQGEKSCWIAVSNSHTYFMLDVNYHQEKGKSPREPFLLISCHQNKDLKKVEVGYGMQYTRLVYGGDSGQTYLLLPRCGKSTFHLLNILTASRTASADGKITIYSSPFSSRPLVQGQSAVVGYFLAFMRQEQLVTQKRSMKDISSMAFPQDVYPLRELTHQMLPVSIIITKEEILVASDRYASWPDEEGTANRWHLEKRGMLGDIVQMGTSKEEDSVNRMRFSLEFEQEDERIRWNFCAQTVSAIDDITSLIKKEWELKWRMPLTVVDLDISDDPVTRRSRIWFRKEGSVPNVASSMS